MSNKLHILEMADAIEGKKDNPVLLPPFDLFWLWLELNQSLRIIHYGMNGSMIQHLNLNETFRACEYLNIPFCSEDWETIKEFEHIAINAFYAMQRSRSERGK